MRYATTGAAPETAQWGDPVVAPDVRGEVEGFSRDLLRLVHPVSSGTGSTVDMVVKAEISEQQLIAMADLYHEWADEDGRVFDYDGCLLRLARVAIEGRLIPLVLCADGKPVGCASAVLFEDDLNGGRVTAWGDQLYIQPAYREHNGTRTLLEAGQHLCAWMGAKIFRVPSKLPMKDFYRNLLPDEYQIDTVVYTKEL